MVIPGSDEKHTNVGFLCHVRLFQSIDIEVIVSQGRSLYPTSISHIMLYVVGRGNVCIYFGIYENVTENPSRLVGYIMYRQQPRGKFECCFQWFERLKRRYFYSLYAVHLRRGIDVLLNRLKIKERKFPVGQHHK